MSISRIFSWVSLTGLLWACPVWGQAAKPQTPTQDDYGWSTMRLAGVSGKGDFVSYHLDYPSGQDTLFVMTEKGERRFSFPKGYRGNFDRDRFLCLQPGTKLTLCDLKSGTVSTLEGVEDYEILAGGNLLLLKDGRRTITCIDRTGKALQQFENVAGYAVSPKKDKVAISVAGAEKKVLLLALDEKSRATTIQRGALVFHALRWDGDGKCLAFVSHDPDGRTAGLFLYSVPLGSMQQRPISPQEGNFTVSDIAISGNGKRVAFSTMEIGAQSPGKEIPQVWNSRDPVPFSSRPRFYPTADVWVWLPETDAFRKITDAKLARAVLSSDLRYAVLEDPMANRPSFKPEADRDLFVQDLLTGATVLFLSGFSGQAERLVLSPDGTGVCYFAADHWFFYDFRTQRHRNLTGGLGVKFGDEDNDRPEPDRPYALPVWSADGKTMYLYDKFDIWAFDQKGGKRLTHGRERSLVFRFVFADLQDPYALVSQGVLLDGKKPVLLSAVATDHSVSGYFVISGGKVHELAMADKRFSKPKVSDSGTRLFWTEEDFDLPPRIVMLDKASGKKEILFSSNPQQREFAWGRSESMTYQNASGRLLKASLFYPADYDPAKTYPMVVHVYERQRASLHEYVNPSLKEGDGFNRTNLTLQGYFVLYPDIVHRIGDPAASAVDCVESAVRKALSTVPVDAGRLGIIGHSMGGYLVNCIVTRSNMFKAAVAGASIADTTSWYLSMGYNTGIPDASRFEYEQMRIGKSFFEDKEAYRRNSPIEFAEDINSALLLWTGENDTQVKPWQSMEFHMALRRLGKENVLLIYPDEDHALSLEKNQVDLTSRIESWFRKYLKPEL